jgi:hypothetical protein
MASIALFCEGASEARVLKRIVSECLGDDIPVNPIQPELTPDGRQKNPGGWLDVLEHCKDEFVQSAFATNDFLIIQIDTDTCPETHYDVNIFNDQHEKVSDDILYDRVVERLKRDISPDVLSQYANQIIFAICINEIECWLLPLYYSNEPQMSCSTTGCIGKLNRKLSADNLGIPSTNKNSPQAISVYNKILRQMKRKIIPTIAQYNVGFCKFVEQLNIVKSSMESVENN